jgi:transposase
MERVANIGSWVVADHIDDSRRDDLYRIGVDEVFYLKGRFLTVVADHDRGGAVVWAKEGRNAAILNAFYDELGDERKAGLEAVSLDLGAAYETAMTEEVPHATQCVDPLHVVLQANKAIDAARRWAWNRERRINPALRRSVGPPPQGSPPDEQAPVRQAHPPGIAQGSGRSQRQPTRCARSATPRTISALLLLAAQRGPARPLPSRSAARCRAASRLVAGVGVPVSHPRFRQALEDHQSQPRPDPCRRRARPVELEARGAQHSKIRLINHRGYGHHSAAALISMIYLCCGGITVQLPTER